MASTLDSPKGVAIMPVYTCTIAESTLSADTKRELAGEIARIHSSINHVPSTYVNVAFYELSADCLYTDGEPAKPVLVSGWVREHDDFRGPGVQRCNRLGTNVIPGTTRYLLGCSCGQELVRSVVHNDIDTFAR